MKRKLYEKSGNVLIVSMIFIAIFLCILMFIIAIFMSNVNSILYGVKTDMYTINKAAVESVDKNQANVDNFTYNKKEYKKYFIQALKKNYDLNDELENQNGLISKVEIKEYEIYKIGEKDSFTDNRSDDVTIHSVIEIRVRPIILKDVLEDVFVFTLHEDVNLNMAKR